MDDAIRRLVEFISVIVIVIYSVFSLNIIIFSEKTLILVRGQ